MALLKLTSRMEGRGFTLTELAIVLGVVGIIIGGIWSAASSSNQKTNLSRAFEELQSTNQAIVNIWQAQTLPPPYAGGGGNNNMTPQMITAKAIPLWAVVNGTTAVNPWSGGFDVFAMSPKKFRLSLYQVPLDACISLLTQVTNCQTGQSSCPVQIYTYSGNEDGSKLTVPVPDTTTGWRNFDIVAARTMCSFNTAHPANNSVEFDYAL